MQGAPPPAPSSGSTASVEEALLNLLANLQQPQPSQQRTVLVSQHQQATTARLSAAQSQNPLEQVLYGAAAQPGPQVQQPGMGLQQQAIEPWHPADLPPQPQQQHVASEMLQPDQLQQILQQHAQLQQQDAVLRAVLQRMHQQQAQQAAEPAQQAQQQAQQQAPQAHLLLQYLLQAEHSEQVPPPAEHADALPAAIDPAVVVSMLNILASGSATAAARVGNTAAAPDQRQQQQRQQRQQQQQRVEPSPPGVPAPTRQHGDILHWLSRFAQAGAAAAWGQAAQGAQGVPVQAPASWQRPATTTATGSDCEAPLEQALSAGPAGTDGAALKGSNPGPSGRGQGRRSGLPPPFLIPPAAKRRRSGADVIYGRSQAASGGAGAARTGTPPAAPPPAAPVVPTAGLEYAPLLPAQLQPSETALLAAVQPQPQQLQSAFAAAPVLPPQLAQPAHHGPPLFPRQQSDGSMASSGISPAIAAVLAAALSSNPAPLVQPPMQPPSGVAAFLAPQPPSARTQPAFSHLLQPGTQVPPEALLATGGDGSSSAPDVTPVAAPREYGVRTSPAGALPSVSPVQQLQNAASGSALPPPPAAPPLPGAGAVNGSSASGSTSSGAGRHAASHTFGIAVPAPEGMRRADMVALHGQPQEQVERHITNQTYILRLHVTTQMAQLLFPPRADLEAAHQAAAVLEPLPHGHARLGGSSTYTQLFKQRITVVDERDRAWPVQYEGFLSSGQRHYRLTSGWVGVMRAQQVAIGDTLVLERWTNDRWVIHLHIRRKGEAPEGSEVLVKVETAEQTPGAGPTTAAPHPTQPVALAAAANTAEGLRQAAAAAAAVSGPTAHAAAPQNLAQDASPSAAVAAAAAAVVAARASADVPDAAADASAAEHHPLAGTAPAAAAPHQQNDAWLPLSEEQD